MASRKRRNSYDFNINFGLPFLNQKFGVFAGVLLTLLVGGAIFSWIFFLALDGDIVRKGLIGMAIVNGVVLALNLFIILKIGYDGFWKGYWISWGVNIILTEILFLISGTHFLNLTENGQSNALGVFLEIILVLFLEMFLAVLPTLVISLIVYIVMAIFGVKN